MRSHFHSAVCATTAFCFYEALGVLKTKWSKQSRPDSIDQETYLSACQELCALVEDENIQIEVSTLHTREFFDDAERITKAYNIDLSDSFQLVSLKKGMMARLAISTRPVLITEDKDLRKAAKAEGLEVLGLDDLPST